MKKRTKKLVAAGGAGLALAAAAAAGAYFLYGKGGASRRRKIRGWALKARREALQGVKRLKKLDRGSYNRLIDTVAKRYRVKANQRELAQMVRELKGHWASISKQLNAKPRPKRRPARKGKGERRTVKGRRRR